MTSILRELLHHLNEPTLNNQSFGLGLDIMPNNPPVSSPSPLWTVVQCPTNISDKQEFQVSLDVQQFKPDELCVNIKGDSVVVHGEHEEKKDQHGFVSRKFTRRYCLPETIDSDALRAYLSSDGVLQLTAPLRKVQGVNIPIIETKEPTAALLNGSCETATVNGDYQTVNVNGDSQTANVNGDSQTANVNGDTKTLSPSGSPNQPATKKPRTDADN